MRLFESNRPRRPTSARMWLSTGRARSNCSALRASGSPARAVDHQHRPAGAEHPVELGEHEPGRGTGQRPAADEVERAELVGAQELPAPTSSTSPAPGCAPGKQLGTRRTATTPHERRERERAAGAVPAVERALLARERTRGAPARGVPPRARPVPPRSAAVSPKRFDPSVTCRAYGPPTLPQQAPEQACARAGAGEPPSRAGSRPARRATTHSVYGGAATCHPRARSGRARSSRGDGGRERQR